MGLRINQNITALNAHRNLSQTDSALSKSLEKLSSGLRINRAADDAAGLAISEKMRTQVRGLAQATRNAQDGISLIQTAEGALNETHSILQRMRLLAIQAANDTNTPEDRAQIQQEIDQLVEELDRIADTTEFNTKKLLDGSAGYTTSAQNGTAVGGDIAVNGVAVASGDAVIDADLQALVTNIAPGADTEAGVYTVSITTNASQAVLGDAGAASASIAAATAGALMINGVSVNIAADDTLDNVILKINNVSGQTGVVAAEGGNNGLLLTTEEYGSSATINVSGSNELLQALGLTTDTGAQVLSAAGTDIVGTIGGEATVGVGATLTGENGLSVTIDPAKLDLGATGSIEFSAVVDTSGMVTLHIGANKDQVMDVYFNDMRAKALGVEGLKVTDKNLAEEAIATLDTAINTVSTERSRLGAYQNRLEHTIANLGVAQENLSAAESRIRDVDMAEEMMEFTRAQILLQAGTAMLAQANLLPQSVLQLLG
ncbi:MAG: flagellin [Candidatus Atribacteria bacterium]|nr:flagellin [Candidatus Atribacteria bacterium]